MTYPEVQPARLGLYVQSHVDLGRARGPRLAIAWHMAEGGGTVGYLSRPNPNGVSVHYVIEGTGRIVQMLRLDRMHTSIRASSIRTTDDAPYLWRGTPIRYGKTARTKVMGKWGSIANSLGPNHASIGVELEGFARNGPNDKQKDAMARLYADLRRTYPGIRSLGHRDFASYKGCPGKLIPWEEVGGHGPAVAEDDDMDVYSVPGRVKATLKAGTPHYDKPSGKQTGTITNPLHWYDLVGQSGPTAGWYLLDGGGDASGLMRWVKASDVTSKAPITESTTAPYTVTIKGAGKETTVGTVTLP